MAKTPEKKKKPIANGEYKSDARLAREAEKRNAVKKAAIKKLVVTGVAAVLAIAIVITGIVFAYNKVLDSGVLMRGRNAMETVNFKVTNAMMSYYIYDNLNDYVDEIGKDYLASYKLDLNKSLKKQKGKDTGNMTWFEFFLSEAMDETEEMLLLLEGAKRDNITLTDAELEAVKTEAASLKPSDYGRGVRAEDIETAMIYRATADKYATWLEESVSVSAEEIAKYIEDNKDKFLEVNYRYYTVKYDKEGSNDSSSSEASDVSSETTSSDSDAEEKAGRNRLEAKELAKQLEACATEEEFIAKVTELFGADLEDEEKERLVENTLFEGLKKSASGDVAAWAFDEDTKVNDTKNIEDESKGSFTVYMLVSEPAVNESPVAEIYRILFTDDLDDAKAEAEKVFGEWEAGEKTEAAFENLGKAQTNEDIEYGYFEAIYKNQLDKALDEWVYDEARKEGDTVLLEDGDGWNILYFKALGEKQCDYEARKALFNEKLDALYEVLEDDYTVILHRNYMNSIPA